MADVFGKLREMSLKVYHLDSAKFPSAPARLAWQAALTKTSKIRIINWYWYAVNGRKGKKGGICHSFHQYAEANIKYMEDYDRNKESSYLKYWNVNYLYGWTMSQKPEKMKTEKSKSL